jgi:hypothetical protein
MVHKQDLYDSTGNVTGCILTASFNAQVTVQQKLALENQLMDYAFHLLYPNTGLNIYRNMYADTPSIVVIKNINALPATPIVI